MEHRKSWDHFKQHVYYDGNINLMLDYSRMKTEERFFSVMAEGIKEMFALNRELEAGGIVNPDENRMVGHYWLRSPELAPSREIQAEIRQTAARIKEFASAIHAGKIKGGKGKSFKNAIVAGIGGSSLGTRFIHSSLSQRDRIDLFFLDNTDPDGMDRIFQRLKKELNETLVIVISKSGGTIETRNAMEELRRFFQKEGVPFSPQAVCISQKGSALQLFASEEGWLELFPMWDWVGGRTSVLSPVGLLPLALQGIDIDRLLTGARECDELTRGETPSDNPAALMALMWFAFTGGRGDKNLAILPYKDRLALLTPYLQQLIMESLGKGTDLTGHQVSQGITVFGNKGSTDQHSYLQQLLDGADNCLALFIEVLEDRENSSPVIAEESTSGDYLHAFLHGTREALSSRGKESMTITIPVVDEFYLGVLIALFERAVTFYAALVKINAYNQPAVELGKKSAAQVISLKNSALEYLKQHRGISMTAEELGEKLAGADKELLFKILLHLSANKESGVRMVHTDNIFAARYWIE